MKAWFVDGRGRQVPERSSLAKSEEEFREEFVETVVQSALPVIQGYSIPDELDQEQACRYHANYLRYFSFFAWKFPSWLGDVAVRCPFQDVRRTVIEDLVDEEVADVDAGGRCHIDVLYDEAEACGMSRHEITSTTASPVLKTCIHAFENIARSLSWQASFAGISALEIIQSEPATKLRAELLAELVADEDLARIRAGRRLPERTGLSNEQLVFQTLHEYKDKFHGGGELALIVKYAATKEIQEEMLWAAETCVQIYTVMREEIDRLAYEAVGVEPVKRTIFVKPIPA